MTVIQILLQTLLFRLNQHQIRPQTLHLRFEVHIHRLHLLGQLLARRGPPGARRLSGRVALLIHLFEPLLPGVVLLFHIRLDFLDCFSAHDHALPEGVRLVQFWRAPVCFVPSWGKF